MPLFNSYLHQGVDFQHILDIICDNVGKQFQRLHLTRKDNNNMEGLMDLKRTRDITMMQLVFTF